MKCSQLLAGDELFYPVTTIHFYVAFVMYIGVSLWSMKCVQWRGLYFLSAQKSTST